MSTFIERIGEGEELGKREQMKANGLLSILKKISSDIDRKNEQLYPLLDRRAMEALAQRDKDYQDIRGEVTGLEFHMNQLNLMELSIRQQETSMKTVNASQLPQNLPRLPIIKLGEFGGNPREWPEFQQRFQQ